MGSNREGAGRPRLIMLFEESGQFPLEIYVGAKMIAYRRCLTFSKAVIKPLAVGIFEHSRTLLLKDPLQGPSRLRP